MLKMVIAGGQCGADQGGLYAAEKFKIKTGGWIPKGFLTEFGSQPELGKRFGLVETASNKYPPRTYANAEQSDGTIRFARDFNSRGEICTLNAIEKFQKPYIDIDVPYSLDFNESRPVSEVVAWIKDNNIEVLNVAGNRATTCPGIQQFTIDYLTKVFVELGHQKGVG